MKGLGEGTETHFISEQNISFRLSRTLGFMLGNMANYAEEYSFHTIKNGKPVVFSPFNLKPLQPLSIIIYSDLVKPTIFGDAYVNILKLVPLPPQSESTEMTIYESHHLDYIPVKMMRLNTIHFKICTHSGDTIHFQDQSLPSIINLVLKRNDE
jgi:hypothetical protein